MFLLTLKKFVTHLFFPLPLLLITLGIGIWMIWNRRRSRPVRLIGRLLLVGVLVSGTLIGITGGWWLGWLTNRHPPLTRAALAEGESYCIAVFGGGFYSDPGLPGPARFGETMLLRLGEAARVARLCREAGAEWRLMVSIAEEEAPAALKRQALEEFFALYDIAPGDFEVVGDALNSRAEMRRFAESGEKLILVSSAWHMPRLMMLAGRNGADALPAPVGMRSQVAPFSVLDLIPSEENFEHFRRFVYESMGMIEVALF